jgi:hypothetical protein
MARWVIARPALASVLCALSCTLLARGAAAQPAKTSVEQGFELGDVQAPRSLGMGGSLYALGTSTIALYQNPANLALARMYHFEALAAFSPEAKRQSYGGAIVDSMTNRLAGGLSYSWSQIDPGGVRREWHDIRLGLGYPISDRIGIGVVGRYVYSTQPVGRGPFGSDIVSDGTPKGPILSAPTFDAGLTIGLADNFRVAVVGKNLTNSGTGVLPMLAGGGAGFFTKDVSIEVDGQADLTTWGTPKARVSVGGELFLADRVAIRAGYRYDDGLATHALSAGLGYIDRKWSVELGGRHDANGPNPATMLALSLRFFYDGARMQAEEAEAP